MANNDWYSYGNYEFKVMNIDKNKKKCMIEYAEKNVYENMWFYINKYEEVPQNLFKVITELKSSLKTQFVVAFLEDKRIVKVDKYLEDYVRDYQNYLYGVWLRFNDDNKTIRVEVTEKPNGEVWEFPNILYSKRKGIYKAKINLMINEEAKEEIKFEITFDNDIILNIAQLF